MPSWQASVMNTLSHMILKPMMRLGGMNHLRKITQMGQQQQEKSMPQDIRATMVSKEGYAGEWVRIAGKRPRRTILYFPGGGFIMRTPGQHKKFVARICRVANASALVVHYRLAPEVPFPGGLEDCLAAYQDLLAQGIRPGDITVAGDSAGGGLVLSTLLALRDKGSPMPGNAIVLSPLADLTYSGNSRKTNRGKDPMIPDHEAEHLHQLYIGEGLPEDRYLSPVLADFDGLPPILGQVGSTELLLDDTVRAADQADRAGVPFFLEIWDRLPHVFPLMAFLPESRVAVERMAKFINTSRLDKLPKKYGHGSIPFEAASA